MKTKTPLFILASAILSCLPVLAQDVPPPPPGGPQVAPPRGEQPRPPGGERPPRPEGEPPRPPGGERPLRAEGEVPRPPGGERRPEVRPEGQGRPGEHGHEGGPRPDGGPREGQGPHRDRGPGEERHPEAPREPQAFLGVSTAPVPPPLAAQLGLPEGYGLLVAEVLPESPAGKTGLQRFDVLKMLDDQRLVDPQQLATLVRGAGKGKEVTLTVIRKAQEQKMAITLGEHVPTAGGPGPEGFSPGALHERIREVEERGRGVRERVQEMQGRARELQERVHQGNPPPPPGPGDRPPRQSGEPEGAPGTAAVSPEELLREAQPGGGAQIRLLSESSVTTLEGAKSRLRLKDHDGEIEVAAENGQRTLTARDPEGKVVFTGPVDTAEQRAAVPETFRNKLAQIHVQAKPETAGEVQ